MSGLRVLFVTTGLGRGGAEVQLVRVALRLNQRGWKVSIASMLPPTDFLDTLNDAHIKVFNLNMRRKMPDPRAILRLAIVTRQVNPAIVHSYMLHANLLSRICRLVTKVPVLICSARSINEGGRWREWAYRVTDPLCDLMTQVCVAGAERYTQRRITPAHKMLYIPNGIDTNTFTPNSSVRAELRAQRNIEGMFVWLTVGRLEPPKDYPNLLQAFQQVVSKASLPTRLLIVGQGPLREEIEHQIIALGIERFIDLLGVRTDIPALLNAADAFVLASAWEGMPLVLLEAAACARPIVATDVGGNREVVLHGETGYLVPPGNPDALADAMLRLMNLPEPERRAMGQAGRQHIVKNFDIERIVDRWEQLYLELLERKNLLQRDRA